MEVCKMIEMARNNDSDAKIWIDMYYEPVIREYVSKKYGDKASEVAVESLPGFVEEYLSSKTTLSLYSFLCQKCNIFEEQNNLNENHTHNNPKVSLIGSKIDINNQEQYEYVVQHYTDQFYQKIKRYNYLLDECHLRMFCNQFIKNLYAKKLESNNDIRNIMCSYIKKEIDNYCCDEEKLLKRYVMLLGVNHSILNYFYTKYLYLLDDYKYNGQYNNLKLNYKNIVLNSLLSIVKTSTNISVIITRNLNKEYRGLKEKEKQEIFLIRTGNCENKNQIIENYSYFIEFIYNKLKNEQLVDDKVLKVIIERRYNDFINAYLNGKSNNDIARYLSTRLLKWVKEYRLQIQINNTYNSYIFYVDKYLQKISYDETSHDIFKEKLLSVYDGILKKYYEKPRKTPIDYLIRKALKDEIDKINNVYIDACDINLSYKVKKEKIISKGGINNVAN